MSPRPARAAYCVPDLALEHRHLNVEDMLARGVNTQLKDGKVENTVKD